MIQTNQQAPKPIILFDPYPRSKDLIFRTPQWERLQHLATVISHEEGRMHPDLVEQYLPETVAIMGQTDMPAERLSRAKRLKAILNVEGNFWPNVDYETCFQTGIYVLAAAPAFSLAVAECALAFAIDLARGITSADRDFRAGLEKYGLESNRDTFSLFAADVGLVGFGNLARALLPFLAPFHCSIKVYDPWMPDGLIRENQCNPSGLDELLSTSRLIFVLATVTTENEGFMGERELMLIRPGSVVLLMSRAAVIDFPCFLRFVEEGRFRAATDVFPLEPVPPDDPVRRNPGLLLSAHRTGALRDSFYRIGEMAVDDLSLILSGLPPIRMQQARREIVSRYRSKPGRSYAKNM